MSRVERVAEELKKAFPDAEAIEVQDKTEEHLGHREMLQCLSPVETHLDILIRSSSFEKRKTIEIHREINKILQKEFNSGLHAVNISCTYK